MGTELESGWRIPEREEIEPAKPGRGERSRKESKGQGQDRDRSRWELEGILRCVRCTCTLVFDTMWFCNVSYHMNVKTLNSPSSD